MEWRHFPGQVGATIRASVWWTTTAPFCFGTDLPALGASSSRPLRLSGEPDRYPVTELLGRLQWFCGRVRFARSTLILLRAVILCALVLLAAKMVETATSRPTSAWLPLALFVLVLWAIHLSLHHAITPFEVARLVDRRMNLDAQVATAVEFTLADRLDRPLARTQVRFATNRLRDLEPNDAVPLVVPGRDLRLLALVAILYGVVAYTATLGLNLPRPLRSLDAELAKQAGLEAQAPSPFTTIDPSRAQIQQSSNPIDSSGGQGSVQDELNALKQQLDSQQITDAQYAQDVQKVQQQVAAKAAQSLQAQQALNTLATALKDTSATDAVSTSLTQGNYQQASQQLNDLSKQLGQLSSDARSQLANQFAQAAAQSQKSNPNIARDAAQAAAALKQGDTQAASQALQSLAQSVQQASSQIADQSQLGQDMQSIQQQSSGSQGAQVNPGLSQDNPANANQPGGNAPTADQTDPQGSGPAPGGSRETAGTGGTGGMGGVDGPYSGNGSGLASVRSTGSGIQQDLSGDAGGAGNAPGGNPLGASNPLSVQGVRLTILGRPSNANPTSTSAGDRSIPLTSAGGGNINGLAGSGTVPSNVPINVHQESNVVPLDRQPVVREYFSNANQ